MDPPVEFRQALGVNRSGLCGGNLAVLEGGFHGVLRLGELGSEFDDRHFSFVDLHERALELCGLASELVLQAFVFGTGGGELLAKGGGLSGRNLCGSRG